MRVRAKLGAALFCTAVGVGAFHRFRFVFVFSNASEYLVMVYGLRSTIFAIVR